METSVFNETRLTGGIMVVCWPRVALFYLTTSLLCLCGCPGFNCKAASCLILAAANIQYSIIHTILNNIHTAAVHFNSEVAINGIHN